MGDNKKASLVEGMVRRAGLAWTELAGTEPPRAVVKPANLVYGIEDQPPTAVRCSLA